MKKQVKKWLTLIMAFALILGSVRYNPLSASATEVSNSEIVDTASGGNSDESGTMEEGVSEDMDTVSGDMALELGKMQMFSMMRNARAGDTYTVTVYGSALTESWVDQAKSAAKTEDNRYKVVFGTTRYSQARLGLPTTIELSNCEKFTVTVKDQVAATNFGAYNNGTEIEAYYNKTGGTQYEITPTKPINQEKPGTMNAINVQVAGRKGDVGATVDGEVVADDGAMITIESIVFTMKKTANETDQVYGDAPIDVADTYTVTVYGSALTESWVDQAKSAAKTEDNRYKVVFGTTRYSQARLGLPTTIELSNCEKFTVTVKDQVAATNFGAYNNGTEIEAYYNKTGGTQYEITPTKPINQEKPGTMNAINVQVAGRKGDVGATVDGEVVADDGAMITIESIVFTMKKTADETDRVYGDAPIDATVTTKYYTFNDVAYNKGYGNDYDENSISKDTGALSFSYTQSEYGYQPIAFTLPENIETETISNITFHFKNGDKSKIIIKVFEGEISNSWSDTANSGYDPGTGSIDLTSDKTANGLKYFALVHNSSAGEPLSDIEIDYFSITAVQTGGLETPPEDKPTEVTTRYYTFNDVTYNKGYGNDYDANSISKETGALSFSYTQSEYGYQPIAFTLPENIETETISNITFHFKNGDKSKIIIKVFEGEISNSWSDTANSGYDPGTGSIDLTSDKTANGLKYFALVHNSSAGEPLSDIEIDYFSITAVQTGGLENPPGAGEVDPTENITPAGDGKDDISAKAGTLEVASANATYVKTATDQYQITFDRQYQELKLNLATPVNLLQCTEVTFAVSQQSAGRDGELGFKLYMKDGSEVPKYNNQGKTLYEFPVSRTGEVVAIGVMLNNAATTSQTCVFDGVCFTMDTTLSTETKLVEFPAAQLTSGKAENATCQQQDGEYAISFSAKNSKMWFDLPETVNMANCISVIFEVSGQTQPLNFHVGTENQELKNYWYNANSDKYTLEALCDKKINQVCLQLGDDKTAGEVTLKKVSFLMRETSGEDPEPEPDPVIEGTPNITPAGDGKDDISAKAGTLEDSPASTATYVKTTTDQYQVTFDDQYKELKLNLATPVNLLQCTEVTFAVSQQSAGTDGELGFKLYMEDGTVVPKYNNKDKTLYTFPISRTEKVVAVGVMLNNAAATSQTCVFDGVCFTMNTALSTNTELVEFPASQLTAGKTQDAACAAQDGGYAIDFSAVNSEVWFDLPETVNMANCISVIFEVSGQTQPLNFHVGEANSKLKSYWYNSGSETYTLEALCKEKINQVCLQLGNNQAAGQATLKKVSFLMRETTGEEPEPTPEPEPEPGVEGTPNITPAGDGKDDISAQAGTLKVASVSSATYVKTTTDQYQITFDSQYQELKLNLATPVNLLQCTEVTFAVSQQSVGEDGELGFKLYMEDGTVVPKYNNQGKTLYSFPISRTDKVVAVGVMLNNAAATSQICVFDGVCFTMNTALSTNTELVEFPASQLTAGKTQDATCAAQDGGYAIDFSAVNSEVWFNLPETVNMANCISVIFEVSGQTQPLNFHVGEANSKLKSYWYNSGSETYTLEALCRDKINQVCLQLGNNQAAGKVTLKKVSFLMRETTGEEPEPEPEPEDPEVPADKENITPVKAESKRMLAGNLKIAHANVTEYKKTTADQIQITFSGEWSELKLKLPETVNMLQCKGVTFAVSEQTVPLSFKLYKEGDLDTPVSAWYHEQNESGIYTYDISSAETVAYIGIMLHKDDVAQARAAAANYCVFDGVVFDMDTAISTETHTVTIPAHELKLKTSEAASCNLENGNWMIRFSNMDQKVNFTLPEIVNLEKCVNIIVTVATQNGPMNFYVSMDGVQQGSVYNYNTGKMEYVLEPNAAAKINEFGIQCGRENNGTTYVPDSFLELVSVSFLMRGSEPETAPADNVYSAGKLYTTSKDADVTQEADANGVTTITFPRKDNSITYEVPDAIPTNHMTSIQFLPSLSGVKVQLLNAKGKVLMEGTESVLTTNCNPEVKYIRLVSLADNTELTLDGIKFNVDPNAFEAIVLNGRFEREDLSMWNGIGTWGNATITAYTSDTEIIEGTGIYSYGEITGRESPYHCFAQDVSDRTEHQTGYKFSFWAKLSDDYKGASPELRTVEFSPYYIDANGKTNYNMYRTGAYKQVLEPGVWTHFSGIVNLPSGAQGFIIRIVEQGTNYGQGTCLKGSYAVTGVSLTPTGLATEPNYKWSGGGSRSNTITKEATCEVAYELKDLSIDWASAKAAAQKTGMQAEFTNNYDEVRLKLPRTLDMSTCAWIRLNVPAQNVPIALKLYRKGKQVDVAYYNDIAGSYLMVPEYDGMIDAIGIMSLSTPNPAGAFALADLITFGLTQEPAPEEVSNSIVINGDFADEDMSDWSAALWGNGVTITQQTASKPIFGDTYTYATYSRRTSPYQCFAQDITGRVQQNETYTFSFWAKLSNDYKGAPENQRVVQFAPYTVDKNGKEDYNPRLDGVYSQVLEPGVWTYFEGTYKVTNDNPISKVVIRILEQGTNYGQGDCVMGSYSVAGVRMARYIPEPPSIDEDVPNLKDAMAEVFGDDFIMGTAVTVNEMEDLGIEMLVNKHFNAVTIGNELKPDALFNYSNDEHTPLQTITFNGEKLEVPTLYFGRAEEILDTLKKWNESHPDQEPIKVRGHVLVWHSQTPEWFFREGYTVKQNADGSENYVTPEVMNQRLEWYIKTVLEHFTGEDSPYKDMFYGWDVVNEAVSNGGNGYRTEKASAVEPLSQSTHSTNSSWWAVYQSNEFILNAFRFANQYAPADVELYYNDYNECDNKKVAGIVKLLKDVKEAEGTRIDGMGMQGHYNMFNPYMSDIERAIRAYSEVVDKVMYTEFDMKVSGDISQDEAREKEYVAQAERYHDIYVLLKNLNAEEGINIAGFTVWGTVDKYSWLQNSSDVGGGADGTLTQCPLLFDYDYKVKPSYWAFVDYTMVDPDWTEEKAADEAEEPKPEEQETPEVEDTPETQPEAEPVVEPSPVIEEQKKNNPALVIGLAVGAVVLGAGAGVGFYFFKKKKKVTK